MTQAHVEPPLITLSKINHDDKSDTFFVKLKLSRDPTSVMLYHYNFKKDLIGDWETE